MLFLKRNNEWNDFIYICKVSIKNFGLVKIIVINLLRRINSYHEKLYYTCSNRPNEGDQYIYPLVITLTDTNYNFFAHQSIPELIKLIYPIQVE